VTDDPLVVVVLETCIELVRDEMEDEGEDGEEGASWRKDSMNCWIWRLRRTWEGEWECGKTGREWSVTGPDENKGGWE